MAFHLLTVSFSETKNRNNNKDIDETTNKGSSNNDSSHDN